MMLSEAFVNAKAQRTLKAQELTGSQVVVDMRSSSGSGKGNCLGTAAYVTRPPSTNVMMITCTLGEYVLSGGRLV